MNHKYKTLSFVTFLVLLNACNDDISLPELPPPSDEIQAPEIQVQNKFYVEQQMNALQPSFQKAIDLISLESSDLVIDFYNDGIRLTGVKIENDFLINSTPTPISKFYAQTTEGDKVKLFEVTPEVKPYSKTKLMNQSTEEMPKKIFTFNGLADAAYLFMGLSICDRYTGDCNAVTTPTQRGYYEVHIVNIKNFWNDPSSLKTLSSYFKINCESYSECASYSSSDEYAQKMYIVKAIKNLLVDMEVTVNPQNVCSVYGMASDGGRGIPDINKKSANEEPVKPGKWGGTFAMCETHLMEDPFGSDQYNTIYHETSHIYGFSHDSGMTYGFGDYYGEELSPQLPNEERTGQVAMKVPDIYFDVEHIDKGHLKFMLKTSDRNENDKVNARLLSPKPINAEVKWKGNEVDINFTSAPEAMVYFMFYTDKSEQMATLALNADEI